MNPGLTLAFALGMAISYNFVFVLVSAGRCPREELERKKGWREGARNQK